jgi:single-strand DNA-binding protein
MADNSITLVGNLTRDPELRFTTGGRGVASFGIAVSRRYQVNGEWQEQTSYFNIVAWGQLGENAASTLTKGMRVVVSGRLEQREYQNREGEKRTAIEINADEIGPSLRWATASIERNPRTDGNGGGNRGGGNGGFSGGNSGGNAGGGDYFPADEEPF